MHLPLDTAGISSQRLVRRKGGTVKYRKNTGLDAPKNVPMPNLPLGRKATAYGGGGGSPVFLPSGEPFAGETAGGGTRADIYGTSAYGSGYPSARNGSRGAVIQPNLPYFFWPVVFTNPPSSAVRQLDLGEQYGPLDNSSRPGGAMAEAHFLSNNTGSIFHVLADNGTVSSLITYFTANCSHNLDVAASSTAPAIFDNSNVTSGPAAQPWEAVQYYRASSVVLMLDGYNNTASLPSGADLALLNCLNKTIGFGVPLVNAGSHVIPLDIWCLLCSIMSAYLLRRLV
ncbi:hypothetical protein BV25DRAFT_1914928 [Artomyces pyxidatus]|uniref:Uncharacterized protein n=1 Tax=Artomyces pyxidatus TaxID=48021 RepID=A0ACB8T780_9AGAM|nr:hypothetical protein BV25DRAFT_1914928 [Artomyces pyxidatus]